MITSRITAPLVAIALALTLGTALAASLPVRTQGEVSYVTGGLGSEEVQAIESVIGNYPLVLEFAESTGKRNRYISGVEVTITDRQGAQVLAVRTDGPFLLVNLPAGSYQVSATYKGDTKSQTFTVGSRTLRSAWVWPVTEPTDEPTRAPDE